jgi:hypothetical protein
MYDDDYLEIMIKELFGELFERVSKNIDKESMEKTAEILCRGCSVDDKPSSIFNGK